MILFTFMVSRSLFWIFLAENPVEGDICAFRDSSGAYYRARVLKFSQPLGFYFHHKEQARVRISVVWCCIGDYLWKARHWSQVFCGIWGHVTIHDKTTVLSWQSLFSWGDHCHLQPLNRVCSPCNHGDAKWKYTPDRLYLLYKKCGETFMFIPNRFPYTDA